MQITLRFQNFSHAKYVQYNMQYISTIQNSIKHISGNSVFARFLYEVSLLMFSYGHAPLRIFLATYRSTSALELRQCVHPLLDRRKLRVDHSLYI